MLPIPVELLQLSRLLSLPVVLALSAFICELISYSDRTPRLFSSLIASTRRYFIICKRPLVQIWAGGSSRGLLSTIRSISVTISRKHSGNLLIRFDEQSKLTSLRFAISLGNSTSRFRRMFKDLREVMSPIWVGRWVISLQLTSSWISFSRRPISSGRETNLLLFTVRISSETSWHRDGVRKVSRLQFKSKILMHLSWLMPISGIDRMTFELIESFSRGLKRNKSFGSSCSRFFDKSK